ncbi:N-acylethanolamine-hydrolyzing acid amidase-like [Hyla sarda]|uniref:N-acylethanolamine-hydrolyzing acid amidase-like n=1 Tax=Hyla sarda TaxID=327740 RepID=UPI0024C29A1D|nr:N-acylethanolamine-hydrolyzing acid amidase-like [Hyla sarda]XP_056424694.1 N-acylethanolamine-hydrolyzing acid amidase-like [Hyla sarda]
MIGLRLLLLLAPCLSHAQDYAPPRYNLSLDLPPEQRWKPVLKHYNYTELKANIDYVFRTSLPKWVHALIRPLAEIELAFLVPEPYAGEIRGIARTLGINIGDVVALNLCYEATAFCTSIVAQDDKGNVYHGRNLDYNFPDILRRMTMDLDFIQNGKVAYTGTTFVGYVGLWTGQRPYKFTISGDARERGEWWKNAISAFFKRSSPVSWLIRDALNDDKDFEAAALRLSKTPIIAETYYIIGGTQSKEGLIITRNRDGPADLWPLDPLSGEWFHVETNYDHWTTPPPSDDRRTPAIKALNATGQANINTDTLYKVLSVKPVMNSMTVYTTVMSAATPEKYTTLIRNEN